MAVCRILNCDNYPIAICLHCQQPLCVEHLLIHNEELLHKANRYCDEFNQLSERLDQMSFEEKFVEAEDDLTDWLHEQMKRLDYVYEMKLDQLKQKQDQVRETLKDFKEIQQMKILEAHRHLFNAQISKQTNAEQLERMKEAVEQLRTDINGFQEEIHRMTLVNNDQIDFISTSNNAKDDNDLIATSIGECKKSQLRADAEPFQLNSSYWSQQEPTGFSGRVITGFPLRMPVSGWPAMSHDIQPIYLARE